MARQIGNIGSEAHQRHTLLFNESEIILTLRFLAPVGQWFFSAEYEGNRVDGIKITVGVLHMVSANQPFDFVVTDNSGEGIDPFRLDDFADGRCSLFLLEPADMFDVRGVEVPNALR